MRIRIQVKSQRDVDEAALRVDGVLAVVRSGDVVQIIVAHSRTMSLCNDRDPRAWRDTPRVCHVRALNIRYYQPAT